jgi:hypothetical protein
MGRLGKNHAIENEKKIGVRERCLAFDRIPKSSHAASHSTRDQILSRLRRTSGNKGSSCRHMPDKHEFTDLGSM